jgi:hypothetical protein
MKFTRHEAAVQVRNWTTGFKRSVNSWLNRNARSNLANGREQLATEANHRLSQKIEVPGMNVTYFGTGGFVTGGVPVLVSVAVAAIGSGTVCARSVGQHLSARGRNLRP